jgi:hypothetical protein
MIRLSPRIWLLASVAAATAILDGCALHRVDVPSTSAASQIAVRAGRAGYVVAAPHGSSDVNTAEIAAEIARRTGFDPELALRLRALAELIRDAYLRANGEIQKLDVLVEPVDEVTYRASGAKRDGILRLPERALHIELPTCARRDWREAYTAILADFLTQAVTLPVGR